jgi:hypothetical protein
MKKKTLQDDQVRTILSVFEELKKMKYEDLNKFLGSITINEMYALDYELNDWYQEEVLGNVYDEEYGWYNPADMKF